MDTEQKPLMSGFGSRTTAEEIISGIDLSEKVVIVTGGAAGIGLETTRVLSNAGAKVIVGARDISKAKSALSNIKTVEIAELDLVVPRSVDRFAKEFLDSNRPLHILINNAGIMAAPLMRDARGYEMQFATNHLGHFQLTARLWPALKKAGGARVVELSSAGHRFSGVDLKDPNFTDRPYEKWAAYGRSKTANVLFVLALDQRGKTHGVRAFGVHPGGIATNLMQYMTEEDLLARGFTRVNGELKAPPGLKTVEQGAATSVWCAVSPQLNEKGGVYCADCDIAEQVPDDSQNPSGVRRWAVDKSTAEGLWDLSEELTGLKWPD